jgi:hypothetical protein
MSIVSDAAAQYKSEADPSLDGYYPGWLEDVAEDATLEGSMIQGVILGPDALRSVVLKIKSMYQPQWFLSVGPYGENGWIEDYAAIMDGMPLGCVVLVKRNDAGQTQHVMASYRPRETVMHFADLLADEFAGTPLESYFRSETD